MRYACFGEMHKRYQYEKRLIPLYQKRAELLSCPPKQAAAEAAAVAAAVAAGAPAVSDLAAEAPEDAGDTASVATPGLPGFWLAVLERDSRIRATLKDGDRAALLYCQDIRAEKRLRREEGFKLFFFFSENPFFSNQVLSKEFLMRPEGDDLVVSKTIGTDIQWKEGMDLTKSIRISKQRNIRTKEVRVLQTISEEKSFFRFFDFTEVPSPKAMKIMGEDDTRELFKRLSAEYDIAMILRDLIIPRAVNIYLGIEAGESASEESSEED
ncbi:nucleosome assembly [Cyclospora cayetanensis]|uniref:Nucleosome assembly n=1 Tax=Cyclospora cayetanensis TaxID=88456 RepID=A0A1D3D7G3_9EIME|nr:nucleosome assembly [Cyclospora cayetanensis]